MVTKRRNNCPDRGDLGWLSMNPQLGREQAGRRPAVCLSPTKYNRKSGLAIFCPITSQIKGYPFEVLITGAKNLKGVVLSDQLKSLDWEQRDFEKIGKCSEEQLARIISSATMLLKL